MPAIHLWRDMVHLNKTFYKYIEDAMYCMMIGPYIKHAVTLLGIPQVNDYLIDHKYILDPTESIIRKYSNHPSVLVSYLYTSFIYVIWEFRLGVFTPSHTHSLDHKRTQTFHIQPTSHEHCNPRTLQPTDTATHGHCNPHTSPHQATPPQPHPPHMNNY